MSAMFVRKISILLVITFLLSFLAACKNNNYTEDLVYALQYVEIPGDPGYIDTFTFSEDTVYFTVPHDIRGDVHLTIHKILTMNLDGSNMSELSNYSPQFPSTDFDFGSSHINAMTMDNSGNLWIVETTRLHHYNQPDDFDGDDLEKYYSLEEISSYKKLIKLDSTGNTLNTIDLSDYLTNEYSRVSAMLADKDNNIYVLTEGMDDGSILIFDLDGAQRSEISISGWNNSLIRLSDGTIAYGGHSQIAFAYTLRKIDLSTGALGNMIDLPSTTRQVFSGEAGFSYLYSDDKALFGLDEETGDTVHLLNWFDCGIRYNDFNNLTMLPCGRIATIVSSWDDLSAQSSIMMFSKVPRTDFTDKTVLTLATFYINRNLQSMASIFNSTNPSYSIQIIDYSEFSSDDDWFAGITRLSTEIITGNAPDIINMSNLPINQYVEKGVLLDLYELIDADPELNRTDFVEAALRVAEINGGLYQVFPNFAVTTLIGNPMLLGHEPGWTINEFKSVVESNPEADFILGPWMTSRSFLFKMLSPNMDEYINWVAGTVHFDSENFIELLELASIFPVDDSQSSNDIRELIITGRQIMMEASYDGNYIATQWIHSFFGGDIVFKGFPSESRQGNIMRIDTGLAITTNCKNIDGAWEFMRTFLLPEGQISLDPRNEYGFPSNKAAFDQRLNEAMSEKEGLPTIRRGDITAEVQPITQEEADQILALIDSVRHVESYDIRLFYIILENAADYFNGRSSAADTARIIQSRASIYISEQSR